MCTAVFFDRPLGNSVLRFALPLYFLSFWGCIGRVMQASMPAPWMTVVLEMGVLLPIELFQVWAYMHQKGPAAYTLSLLLRRGKARGDEKAESRVYRSVDDLPPKEYTYNFLICVHAVCETTLVLVGGLVLMLMNFSITCTSVAGGIVHKTRTDSSPANERANL